MADVKLITVCKITDTAASKGHGHQVNIEYIVTVPSDDKATPVAVQKITTKIYRVVW